MNLRIYWETRVQKDPSKVFLYYEDTVTSYGRFDDRINQAANGLIELGIKKGDRVCLILPNIPEFLYNWLGLCKIGAVVVPINTNFTANEALFIVKHSEATGLIVSEEHIQTALQIQKDGTQLKWVACVGREPDQFPPKFVRYHDLFREMPTTLKDVDLRSEDLACVIYTSGTTGFPKGVMHLHKTPPMTGEAFLLRAQVSSSDRIMAVLPLFHINAQFYSTWGAIAGQASLILVRRFSAGQFWMQAVRYRATEFNFVGTIGKILSARPVEEFRPEHTIRVAVGAGISPDVYDIFAKRFKIANVIDAYGLTEVPAVSQNPIGGSIKMKSIGFPAKHPSSLASTEMKILDNHGKELPPRHVGELVVRSPLLMSGYWKEPQRTREAIRNGWFYTGDYAYRDEDGYFFFVDRKKDIIRKKGENISPAEVEAVINENPTVLESAVIAVPADLGEDEVMACIVLKHGHSMKGEEMIDWCRPRLAAFKLPRFVQFRKELPKTSTQRIAKPVLKKEKDLLAKGFDLECYIKALEG
ncbi:MAG: AMP-binding protein [Candidatus Binatia bacterium]